MLVSAASQHHWSQRWVFLLALVGATVGLGNIWKFPHLLVEQGGGAFLLVYLCCLLVLGAPMVMAELALGKSGGLSPVAAVRKIAMDSQASRFWVVLPLLSVLTGFIVFAFYSVVSGWLLSYFFAGSAGRFDGLGSQDLESHFSNLLDDPVALLIWHSAFVLLVVGVLLKGIRGLDHAVRVLMPVFFLLLVGFLLVAAWQGNIQRSLQLMLYFDASDITLQTWQLALGHAFFTLSLGMGALIAYGAYLPPSHNIGRSVIAVLLLDTLIGVLVGLVIYTLVFAAGLEVSRGPGLLFITLPFSFGNMAAGQWLLGGFFLLVTIVAWTSAVALLEPAVQVLNKRFAMGRSWSVGLVAIAVWLLGTVALVSFNQGQEWTLAGMTLFDLLDFLSAKVLLPITTLLLVLFVGWQVKSEVMRQALSTAGWLFNIWLVLIRFVVPTLLLIIIWSNIYSRF